MRGNILILYKEYTYSFKNRSYMKGTSYWQCSAACSTSKCKAKLVVDDDGNIVPGDRDRHNHPPPSFVISNGRYVRM